MFYIEDTETRKQESTGTRNRAEATSLLNARNESIRQPHLNLQIAKAYLAGTDSGVATRTWQQALDAIIETKSGSTQDRWRQAAKQAALDLIRHRVILETQGEHLLACLKAGTVSTNVHLRKLAQLLPFNELAAVADYSQASLAGSALQGKTRHHQRRTSAHHWAGKEPEDGAGSTNCAGISAVLKPTSPISRRRTLTGPTKPSLIPGRKPAVWP